MALLLDPRLTVVWRSPTSLQIGVDRVVVTLDDVSVAEERMLAALSVGVSASGLLMIGRTAGASDAEIEAFLEWVRPALAPPVSAAGGDDPAAGTGTATATHPGSGTGSVTGVVAVDGRGPTADRLLSLLAETDFTPVRADAESTPADTSAAIVLAHFVVAPQRAGGWLRRDIPHLPVVFGDATVRIGPFVHPGLGPCLHCVEMHRRDRDPAWPAIASQLLGRTGQSETPTVAWEVATRVTRMLADLTRADAAIAHQLAHSSRHLDVQTGQVTSRRQKSHPECGCRSLPGTATPAAAERDWHQTQPTRSGAHAAPA